MEAEAPKRERRPFDKPLTKWENIFINIMAGILFIIIAFIGYAWWVTW